MNKKDIYTNHSIRATGATILGRNCSMAQIMAVPEHKSASSVAVYQRVSSKEKQVMGDIITSSVRGEQLSQLSRSRGHTKFLLIVNILIIEIVSQTRCFVM